MTRKDYIVIAEALATLNFPYKHKVLDALCKVFKQDNPRFNADLFIDVATTTLVVNAARERTSLVVHRKDSER